LDAGVAKLA
jgi:hypothetical protein